MRSFGVLALLAGAVVFTTASPGNARGPVVRGFGGAHFGGARFVGPHFVGARFGGPYFGGARFGGYHYYPYYGYRSYGYGYYPYSSGYYPYGYGYSPYYSPYYDYSSSYPGLDAAYSPGYANGYISPSPLPGTSPGLAPSAPADVTAHFTVKVPAGANIWINGAQTNLLGTVREFQTDSLTPGDQYTYEIQARWKNDDGREVTQSQQVVVTAGAHVRVDFPIPSGTRAQAPMTKGR
jgi:uncharacterized protein (TIGR03000 family)